MSKYTREIKGVQVDVYDVLKAWNVINPALQHLIKKALQPGARGHKGFEEDMLNIYESAERACELEGVKTPAVKRASGPFQGDVLKAYSRGVEDGMQQALNYTSTANEGSEP